MIFTTGAKTASMEFACGPGRKNSRAQNRHAK